MDSSLTQWHSLEITSLSADSQGAADDRIHGAHRGCHSPASAGFRRARIEKGVKKSYVFHGSP
jgi:hypothetical protein